MKGFLLDTVTISELRKNQRADPHVHAWQALQKESAFWISVITIMEIRTGLIKVRARDPAFSDRLKSWLETLLLPYFATRTLSVDLNVVEKAAEFRAIQRLTQEDALIAATACIHGLTLATRNTSDFMNTGIDIVNPWERRDD